MILLPFFEISYGDRLAKGVKKDYVQVIHDLVNFEKLHLLSITLLKTITSFYPTIVVLLHIPMQISLRSIDIESLLYVMQIYIFKDCPVNQMRLG